MERSLLTVYPNIMKNDKLSILCCLLSLRLLQNLSKVFVVFFLLKQTELFKSRFLQEWGYSSGRASFHLMMIFF